MKIKSDHLDAIKKAVEPLDTPERREQYRQGKFPRSELTKDLDMRYRWDLLWACRLPPEWQQAVYGYANDTHIDTALRSVIKPLKAQP